MITLPTNLLFCLEKLGKYQEILSVRKSLQISRKRCFLTKKIQKKPIKNGYKLFDLIANFCKANSKELKSQNKMDYLFQGKTNSENKRNGSKQNTVMGSFSPQKKLSFIDIYILYSYNI